MGRFSASATRRDAAWRAAIAIGSLLAASVPPAAAQTATIGGSTDPDVTVNESVIDALGPPPTLPGLLRQESAASASPPALRPFTLHPPGTRRSAEVARPKPAAGYQSQQIASAAVPAETAIPTGKASRRTAKTKSQPAAPVTADAGRAAPSLRVASPTTKTPTSSAKAQPVQPASLAAGAPPPASAAPAPATPTGPVPSIVRRYPVGSSPMAAAAPPPQPSAPAPAAQPAAAPAPAASAPTSNPPPATAVAASAAASLAPSAGPATQVAAAAPAPAPAAGSAPPAPPPAPAAAPQVAALHPQGGLAAVSAQVVFAPSITDMPDQAKATLDRVVAAMKADDQIRVQLIAYAGGPPDQSSQARRISLSRAISVRSYLVEQGVKSVRIDVRAMGNRSDSAGPQDRVDVVPIER